MQPTSEDSPGDSDNEVAVLTQDVGVQAGSPPPSPSQESIQVEPEANTQEDLPSDQNEDEQPNNMEHKLHTAIQDNDIDSITKLLDEGAPLEAETSHTFCEWWGEDTGVTPLLLAADLGHHEIVQLLLGRKANKSATTTDRKATVLFVAAWSGRQKVVEVLFTEGAADLEAPDFEGRRPLGAAARNGHPEVVTFLLGQGADVNATDNIDRTALHYAATYGHDSIVESLISSGANIQAKNTGNDTALHFAASNNCLEIVKRLLKEDESLLEMKTSEGDTALTLAAYEGHLPIVQFLLSTGAEIDAEDNQGNTSLHFAANDGNLDMVKHLCAKGSELTRKSNSGRTSLHMACYKGHVETCQFLLERAAGLNDIRKEHEYITARDEDNDTALMDAISKEHSAIVFQILKTEVFFPLSPANVEPQYSSDEKEELERFLTGIFENKDFDDIKPPWEALMYWALLNGNKDIFIKCQDSKIDGLDLKAWKRGKFSYAHLAAFAGNVDLMEYLFQEGLGTLAPNEDKISPFHLAVKHNHIEVVQKFVSWLSESPESEISQKVSEERRSRGLLSKYDAVRDAILQEQHDGETSIALAADGRKESHRKLERFLWKSLHETIENETSFFQLPLTPKARLVLELAAQFEHPGHETYLKKYLDLISPSYKSDHTNTLHLAVHCRVPVVVWWLLSNGEYLGGNIIADAQNIVKDQHDDAAVVIGGILENPPPLRRQKAWRYEEGPPKFQHDPQFQEEPEGTVVDFLHKDHQAWFQVKRRSMKDIIYDKGPENIMRTGQYGDLSSIKRKLYQPEEEEPQEPHEEKFIKRKDKYQPKIKREDGKIPNDSADKPADVPSGAMETDKSPTEKTQAPDVRWIHIHATDLRCAEELMVRMYQEKGLKSKDHLPWTQFVQKSWVQLPAGEKKAYMKPQCLFYQNKSDEDAASEDISESRIGRPSALYMPYIFWHTHTEKIKDSPDSNSANPSNTPNPQSSANYEGPATVASESSNESRTSISQSSQKDQKAPIVHGPMTLDQYYYISLQDTSDRDIDQVLWRRQMRHLAQHKSATDASTSQAHSPPASPRSATILVVNQLWLWALDENTILTCTTKEADNKHNSFLLRVLDELKVQGKTSSVSIPYLKELILSTATGLFNRRDIEFFGEKRSPLEVYRDAILDVTKDEAHLFRVFEKSLATKGSDDSESKGKHNQESKKSQQHNTARGEPVSQDETINPYGNISRETSLLREVKDICDELNMLKNLSEEQEDVWRQIWKDGYNPGAIFTYDTPSEIKAEIEEMVNEAQSVQRAIEMLLDLKQKQANILEAEWTRQQSVESRKQSVQTTKQGETIMVFTVVTIVFLPASFLTSLLAINISDFPHVGDNVRFEGRVVFPIIFGISVAVSGLFTLIAFNASNLKKHPYMKKLFFRSNQNSQANITDSNITDSSATASAKSLPDNSSAESQSACRPNSQPHRRSQRSEVGKSREENAPNRSSYTRSVENMV